MKKTLFVFTLLFFIVALPSRSHAVVPVPFGGLDVFEYPCTCSPFVYIWFAPMFYGPIPATGALAFPDTGVLFPYYGIFPGMWALGLYEPGIQACWEWAGPVCIDIPEEGVITPVTGTGPGL